MVPVYLLYRFRGSEGMQSLLVCLFVVLGTATAALSTRAKSFELFAYSAA